MSPPSITVLVTGANGIQGGSLIRELLKLAPAHPETSLAIHALVRDSSSSTSQSLQALDPSKIELFEGNFEDVESISRAAAGCTTVFVNPSPVFTDLAGEGRHGLNILSASRAAGIKHVVLASVHGLDARKDLPILESIPFFAAYFKNKSTIADNVRNPPPGPKVPEGYTYTILEPSTFLTNYIQPMSQMMYPTLTAEQPNMHVAFSPTLRMSHLDPADVGRFAAHSIYADPDEFERMFANKTIPLASANMTISDVADALTRAVGHKKTVSVSYMPREDAEAVKATNVIVASQLFLNDSPYLADLEMVRSYGIELGSVEDFFEREKEAVARTLAL
ncbi:uncharacterized protein PV06_01086 [Exophiala oligosperma]|uniref:NmrA-like domain-containing protein n=2 Tax=Chaetothyriales TaxID=34395 RepID=A0A0D2EKY3_9EURO|nr:uncharacterized protein PV06_01086 [Exophiala oligosperma]KAJ9641237.1 hypothetical protein H2204_002915 [Knufia peltigerae]KIW48509.1 hypothetical protein PV06_01086 [Exophiala oligosperma]